MRASVTIIFFLGCFIPTITAYDWKSLRVKWGLIPLSDSSFQNLLRKDKVDRHKWQLAVDKGWNFDEAFNVKTYCFKGDPSMCSLYDVNDHIVGMQIGFPASAVDAFGSPSAFRNKPFAKKINRFGTDVYVMTLFFVDPVPELFLNGRSDWDGNVGDGLWLINWTNEKYYFTKIPTDLENMKAEGFTRHNCVRGMGTHYFKELDSSSPCSDIFPIFLTFDDDKPIGFGVYTLGYQLFNKYSKWNEYSIGYPSLRKNMPLCLRLGSVYPGLITTHFYFTPEPSLLDCPA